MSTAAEPDAEIGERELAAAWRALRFLELGFLESAAVQLAEAEADWHQARDLISRGCPLDVAARILL